MSLRRVVVLGTAVAVAVGVVAALLSALEIAVAALGVAILGILAGQVLSARQLGQTLARIERQAERGRRQSQSVRKSQKRLAQRLRRDVRQLGSSANTTGRRVDGLDRRLRKVVRGQERMTTDLTSLNNTMQRTPGLTTELLRATQRLVDHPHPMPEVGGWALSASTLLWILDHLETTQTRTVLECGSGSSTVWIATALERRGGDGQVVALESSDHYAELTRAELDRLGLGHRATVLHAPLVETELPGRDPQPWFDVSPLDLSTPVDLLLVDGPPGTTAIEARYPAFPMLAGHLAPGATVILDDTGRPAEDRIAELWCEETHEGRRLEKARTIDRSTVFVTQSA